MTAKNRCELLCATAIADVHAYDRPMTAWTRDQYLGWHAARGSSVHRDSERFQAGYLFAIAMGRDAS